MKFYAFDPTCHATRTRVGRIEFWKHRLSISVTYSLFLFFSSCFFRSHSSSFFLVAISCFVPPFFFILFPLSPPFCWKLETGSRVRACFCRHCLTWWSSWVREVVSIAPLSYVFFNVPDVQEWALRSLVRMLPRNTKGILSKIISSNHKIGKFEIYVFEIFVFWVWLYCRNLLVLLSEYTESHPSRLQINFCRFWCFAYRAF